MHSLPFAAIRDDQDYMIFKATSGAKILHCFLDTVDCIFSPSWERAEHSGIFFGGFWERPILEKMVLSFLLVGFARAWACCFPDTAGLTESRACFEVILKRLHARIVITKSALWTHMHPWSRLNDHKFLDNTVSSIVSLNSSPHLVILRHMPDFI